MYFQQRAILDHVSSERLGETHVPSPRKSSLEGRRAVGGAQAPAPVSPFQQLCGCCLRASSGNIRVNILKVSSTVTCIRINKQYFAMSAWKGNWSSVCLFYISTYNSALNIYLTPNGFLLALIKGLILSYWSICFLFLYEQQIFIYKKNVHSFPDTHCICADSIIKKWHVISALLKLTAQPNKQAMNTAWELLCLGK